MSTPAPLQHGTGNWRDNAGCSLLDQNDPHGNPIATPLDRRWLWRIESALAVSATNDVLKDLGRDLHQYLGETCDHHWMNSGESAYHGPDDTVIEGIPAHRQCLWCCDTEFGDQYETDHYVWFFQEFASVKHPEGCERDEFGNCPYYLAVCRVNGHGAPIAGRWRIVHLDAEGLPKLDRAADRPVTPASAS